MNVRKAQELRDTLIVVGFLVMLNAYLFGPVCSILGALVMFSALIPDYRYNRCPHCKKRLGRNAGDFCQHCGEKID